MAAFVARLLRDAGECPAILSRGYGRTEPVEGVVVVSAAGDIRADLPRAGDEPLMLARQLHGVSVLVCEDRYLAGRLAEHHLGATVHVLDDGMQHLQLDRDVDIVMVGREDAEKPVTLPSGRLREPLDTLIVADAIVADPGVEIETAGIAAPVFRARRVAGEPVIPGATVPDGPAFAVAGIAHPAAFFSQLESSGRRLLGRLAFADHYPYSARDLREIATKARAAGASHVVTTEKDYVRLLPFRPFPLPMAVVPFTIEPEPLPEFSSWLISSLRAARDIPGD
jgi:tetraacyldisaccharide 4'-kinase